MDVSIPTVNNMVKRLQQEGWVRYKKYKPLLLTASGRKIAAKIVRRHRLAEMFLVQTMGLGWEEVHDIAEDLEHINSPAFFDRIDEMLDFPKTDPHGTPIPDKDGNLIKHNYKTLASIAEGNTVILRALKNETKDFLIFLNKKEIELGIKMKIESKEPFDKSMEISYKNLAKTILSKEVCEKLLVEKVKK